MAKEEVQQLTQLLRCGEDPLWFRMRELLRARGIEPSETALAVAHEDDERFEFGVLVLANGTAIQYGLSYLDSQIENAEFSEWCDLADSYANDLYGTDVDAARALLGAT